MCVLGYLASVAGPIKHEAGSALCLFLWSSSAHELGTHRNSSLPRPCYRPRTAWPLLAPISAHTAESWVQGQLDAERTIQVRLMSF